MIECCWRHLVALHLIGHLQNNRHVLRRYLTHVEVCEGVVREDNTKSEMCKVECLRNAMQGSEGFKRGKHIR